ncbi:hypothetical protein AVEN_265985-1, partial [Araneus ventricosus]
PSGGSMTFGSLSSNVSQKPPSVKHFLFFSADIRFQELVERRPPDVSVQVERDIPRASIVNADRK